MDIKYTNNIVLLKINYWLAIPSRSFIQVGYYYVLSFLISRFSFATPNSSVYVGIFVHCTSIWSEPH